MKIPTPAKMISLFLGLSFLAIPETKAQEKPLSLQDCVNIALQNNQQVKTAFLEVAQGKALEKSSFDPGKTNLMLTQDPTSGGNIDNSLGITQSFALPGLYKKKKKVLQQQTLLSEKSKAITETEVIRNVKEAYYNYLYGRQKIKLLNYLDSIYSEFTRKAEIRLKTGETSNLENITAQNKYQEVQLLKKEAEADIKVYALSLQQLMNTAQPLVFQDTTLTPIESVSNIDTSAIINPILEYFKQSINVANSKTKLEKAKMLPEFTLGYRHQLVISGFNPAKINRGYFPGTRLGGLELGIGVPLFAGTYRAKINAEKIAASLAHSQLMNAQLQLKTRLQQGYQEYLKYRQSLDYYLSSGLKLADEQIRVAQFAFNKGEIGYIEFIQNLSIAVQSKLDYLKVINLYNQSIINLYYLQGDK